MEKRKVEKRDVEEVDRELVDEGDVEFRALLLWQKICCFETFVFFCYQARQSEP